MRKLIALISLVGIIGCAGLQRKQQAQLRNLFLLGEYSKADKELEKSELKKKPENQLLYLMEKGRILFAQRRYLAASDIFQQANDLVDKLYTKDLKKVLFTTFTNDSDENYYGSFFERSMLYYYLALSNLKIYQTGLVQKKQKNEKGKTVWIESAITAQEARNYLFRARAAVVAWNGFFESVRISSKDSTLYQNDLMGKLFAATVHQLVGERTDLGIALQLYKDARQVLQLQGPSYQQYNQNFDLYTRNLYPQLQQGKLKIEPEWISPSSEYQQLMDYLDYQVLTLTRKLRANDYSKTLSQLKPSKAVLEQLKEKNNPNTTILLERSVLPLVEAQEFDYSLNSAIQNIEDSTTRTLVEGIGLPVLTLFAMGPLGLGYASPVGDNAYIYTHHNLGTEVIRHIGIGFEMPVVKEVPLAPQITLNFYKLEEENENTTLVKSVPLLVSGPLGDLARQAANERATASYTKVGVRVALKHLMAILAAFKTYESFKENEFLGRALALTQYMASSKAIKASEQADTRFWSTLPENILQTSVYLPSGKYRLTRAITGQENSEKDLATIEIGNQSQHFFSYHL